MSTQSNSESNTAHEGATTEAASPGSIPGPVETMEAIVQDAYGTVDVLRLASIERPEIADDEVLLQVHAAGLDRGTWHTMAGRPYLMRIIGFGFRRPKNRVAGLDVAGTVVSVGAAVSRFAVGDDVYGIAKGSYAGYAAALEEKLAIKPVNLTFEQAAVVPVSASTALQALDAGRVEAGRKVLILGASGGVGTYAVQLAKAFGAEVTGVSSTKKLDLVRSLGADHVLDYTVDDFASDQHQRYDLILDIGGNPSLSRLRQALTPTGTAILVGGEEGGNVTGGLGRSLRAPLVSMFVRKRLAMLASKEHGSFLERFTPFLEAGQVTPSIDRTYPLDEVPQAMQHLIDGNVRGKIAIAIRH